MAHSKEKRAHARRLLEEGKSRKDIAWIVDISKTTVAFWDPGVRARGLPKSTETEAPQQARRGEPRARSGSPGCRPRPRGSGSSSKRRTKRPPRRLA